MEKLLTTLTLGSKLSYNFFFSACVDGEVRLINGSKPSEGRVEVCGGGQFHSVCDDSWDQLEAQVVCNQLNYSSSQGTTCCMQELTSKLSIQTVQDL